MAASIKCDERPFKGGVWWGFASEVYPPPATRSSTSCCKIFQASKGKQPQAKASKSKPKEAKASKSQLELKFKMSSILQVANACLSKQQKAKVIKNDFEFQLQQLRNSKQQGALIVAFAASGVCELTTAFTP